MTRVLHLSDLHLGKEPHAQVHLFESLVNALRGHHADLVVFTGDVFDSTALDHQQAVDEFLALLSRIKREVGPQVRALVLPGNHDRREAGLVAPFDEGLFQALAERARSEPELTVLGGSVPFLAQRVQVPRFPGHVVAYDSTYLPRGLLSAGGVLRQEDLLEVGEQLLPFEGDGLPLFFLVHHHLVPTPVTDLGEIDVAGKGALVKLAVKWLLPELVAFGDREELTMTAMGAGTALSTLHTLGRPVVVLHGHKHYPTARLLKGVEPGEGDMLLLAAGSCGTSESWSPSPHVEAPRLWPSFNVIELEQGRFSAHSVAFPPALEPDIGHHRTKRRPLVELEHEGTQWVVKGARAPERPFEPTVALNEVEHRLVASSFAFERLDVVTKRRVLGEPGGRELDYHELVEGPKGAVLTEVRADDAPLDDARVPATVALPLGAQVSWVLKAGVCATLGAASLEYQVGTAYEWLGLFNRYRAGKARLVVNLGPVDPARQRPFGSITDLTTGKERVAALVRDDVTRTYVLEVVDCPARALLRIYVPLAARQVDARATVHG